MKTVITLFLLGGFMIMAWVAARLTHVVDFYSIPTSSSEPTYRPGNIIIASRLKKPDTNTFICFKTKGEKGTFVFRCIAKEGDVVELRDAIVYLNGKKKDEPYTWNEYYVSQKELNTIQGYVNTYHYPLYNINDSLYVITLSGIDIKNYNLNLKPHIALKGIVDSTVFTYFRNLKYNTDNFGPIKVPKNSYFLLGDNRHNALDSRYLGFITKDDIISTVIR